MSNTIPNLKEKVQRVVAQPQRVVDKLPVAKLLQPLRRKWLASERG